MVTWSKGRIFFIVLTHFFLSEVQTLNILATSKLNWMFFMQWSSLTACSYFHANRHRRLLACKPILQAIAKACRLFRLLLTRLNSLNWDGLKLQTKMKDKRNFLSSWSWAKMTSNLSLKSSWVFFISSHIVGLTSRDYTLKTALLTHECI